MNFRIMKSELEVLLEEGYVEIGRSRVTLSDKAEEIVRKGMEEGENQ